VACAFNIKEEDIHFVDEKHFIQETKGKEIAYKILDFLRK
jgi:Holliday junction resolvasome RuvABC ATP-dependent DNA helicase subunit